MYVETVPNRNSPPAVLLREGWREHGRVRKRTLANLSHWPRSKIETLRRLLKDQPLVSLEDTFDIVRSKPHGHVAAVLGSVRKLGLERLLSAAPCPERERGGGTDLCPCHSADVEAGHGPRSGRGHRP